MRPSAGGFGISATSRARTSSSSSASRVIQEQPATHRRAGQPQGRCPRDVDHPGHPCGNASDEHHSIVVMTGDPTRTGLAASLARPGGNVTGLASSSTSWRSRDSAPQGGHTDVSRIAVMWNAGNPVWVAWYSASGRSRRRWSVKLQELPVTESGQFEGALRSATAAGAGAPLGGRRSSVREQQ